MQYDTESTTQKTVQIILRPSQFDNHLFWELIYEHKLEDKLCEELARIDFSDRYQNDSDSEDMDERYEILDERKYLFPLIKKIPLMLDVVSMCAKKSRDIKDTGKENTTYEREAMRSALLIELAKLPDTRNDERYPGIKKSARDYYFLGRDCTFCDLDNTYKPIFKYKTTDINSCAYNWLKIVGGCLAALGLAALIAGIALLFYNSMIIGVATSLIGVTTGLVGYGLFKIGQNHDTSSSQLNACVS